MKMKKFIAMLLAGTMALGLAACGGSSAPAESKAEEGGDMRVAMITDYGDITDQSFNQTTYEACKAFCEANKIDFTYYKPEGDSDAEREAMIDKAVSDGYNVVVMPGYAFANAIYNEAPMYENVKFVALDVSEGDLTNYGEREFDGPNVFSAVYQEELAGYMAGVAAVKLGYKKLGFLGGMAVPAVIRYGYGFVQGADAAAAELGVDDVEIKYAYGNQFYGDADITAAMDTWYSGGTEVVFACGGGIFTSACEAAEKTGGKVIGVDVDQQGKIDGDYEDGMCVTSAMKGLAATVNTVLAAIQDDKWADYSGKVETLGLVGEDPAANYVQLAETTAFNDGFTEDDYKALVAAMFNGEIEVSNDTEAEQPSAENVKIDFQGNLK